MYGPPEFVRPQVEVSKAPGVVAGTYPAFKDVMDSKGRVHRVPNPDLFDDPSNPGAIEFFRSVSKWNTTDRIEDIVNWVKSWSSPSDGEVRQLERQLAAIKANPQMARESEQFMRDMYRRLRKKYQEYRRKFWVITGR